jgi:hypothetical protein
MSEIYFVNTREVRANKTADTKGIFQKLQWKQKDLLSMMRKSVLFLFCFGEDILQVGQNTHLYTSEFWNVHTHICYLHVCTMHQQYQGTFLLLQTDAHNYKIIGILKQLK